MGYERDDRYGRSDYGRSGYDRPDHGRDRYGRDEDRGFFQRAGDEVRSWFGDEEAERRRRYDERYDERYDRDRYASGERGGYRSPESYPRWERSNRGDEVRRGSDAGGYAGYDQDVEQRRRAEGYGGGRSASGDRERRFGGYDEPRYGHRSPRGDDHNDYAGWRDRQVSAFDRDYDEYRHENRSRFETEFAAWRQNRQTQRDAIRTVKEHQEIVGSDGTHVGKVDHVRGDEILLTKTDRDAGGHHHAIPSRWIATVDDKVHLSKTAAEAQAAWRDTEQRKGRDDDDDRGFGRGGGNLNRSFPGTY